MIETIQLNDELIAKADYYLRMHKIAKKYLVMCPRSDLARKRALYQKAWYYLKRYIKLSGEVEKNLASKINNNKEK